MRILVTGAGGFLGAHVVARFAAAGHAVRATARRPLPALPAGVEATLADLAADDLPPLLEGCEAVVHCAARASPWGPRAAFVRDNLLATRRLLDAANTAGSVRRFVQISSPSIYFNYRDALDITEDFTPPARWSTPYAETKWLSEQLVLRERLLEPIVLRPRAVIGAGDRAIVPRILAVARRGFFPLPAGGRALIDVTCVDNVVDAIGLALHAPPAATGRAFNITNGEAMTVHALLARLFDMLGLRVRLMPLPRPVAGGIATCAELFARLQGAAGEPPITRYGMGLLTYSQTLSIAAARDLLGYQPRLGVQEGLRQCLAGMRP